jgi:hypothetical protein
MLNCYAHCGYDNRHWLWDLALGRCSDFRVLSEATVQIHKTEQENYSVKTSRIRSLYLTRSCLKLREVTTRSALPYSETLVIVVTVIMHNYA